jgi:hypothetical protein
MRSACALAVSKASKALSSSEIILVVVRVMRLFLVGKTL